MKWIRPSGTEFESNDLKVTIKYLESLGWKKIENPARKVMSPPKEGSIKKSAIKKAVKKVKNKELN